MARAAAIILKDGLVALIERRWGGQIYYLFPGGQVEDEESLHQTVIREIKEELGLLVEVDRLIAEVSFQGKTQYYFLAEVVGGEFGTGRGLEVIGLAPPEAGSYTPVWMPVTDLLQRPVRPRCVAEIIVKATEEDWPEEAFKLHDS